MKFTTSIKKIIKIEFKRPSLNFKDVLKKVNNKIQIKGVTFGEIV